MIFCNKRKELFYLNSVQAVFVLVLYLFASPLALAQSSIFDSYKESAEQFIKARDFDKAEKILKAVVAEAEKDKSDSRSRKNLIASLKLLAKLYRESGNYEGLKGVNLQLQKMGVNSESGANQSTTESVPSYESAPVVSSQQPDTEGGKAAPQSNSESKSSSLDVAKVTEVPETGGAADVTGSTGSGEGPLPVDPSQVEFTEAVKERVKPLKDDVIASAAGIDGGLKISSTLKKAKELKQLRGHISWIKCVEFSADGTKAVSGGADRTIRLWDLASGEELKRFEGHEENVTCVAFSPSGNRLISGSSDQTVKLWDIESGRLIKSFSGHGNIVTCVAFSSTGRLAASGGYDGTIKVWDLSSGRVLKELGEGKLGTVRSIAFLPGEGKLVSGGSDRLITVFDVQSGGVIKKLKGHKGDILSVSVSGDGSRILSSSRDLTARLWTTSTGAEEKKFVGHGNWVLKVAFTTGDNHAISCSLDKTFRLWDLNSGSELGVSTIGPFGMWGVAMSSDGSRALTGSNNYYLRLWQLSQ